LFCGKRRSGWSRYPGSFLEGEDFL